MRVVTAQAGRQVFELARDPHRRAAQRDSRAEFAEQMNIRAGHAAVQDVAENRDVPAFELALAIADGERIEQRLRGMLVRAVAGVQHRNFEALGDEFGRAGGSVADHDAVGAHGFERANRIDQRFALFQAGGFRLEGHRIGAEARRGGGEADARARGRLEESDGDRLAAKSGQFFQRMALKFLEGFRLIENKSDLLAREVFDSEQV